MRVLQATLLSMLLLLPAGLAGQQPARAARAGAPARSRAAPRSRPPAGPVARLRCWSERLQDCGALAERLAHAPAVRRALPRPESGWTQDVELTYRREAAIADAAAGVRAFLDTLRLHRFEARAALQGARRQWSYATSDSLPGSIAPARPRLPQGSLARLRERPRVGNLELALAGTGGKRLTGSDSDVDGVLRNLGARALVLQLARGCDLDVAVTPRSSDRTVALSPCSLAPQSLSMAPGDSFVFRGVSVPSEASGTFNVYASLTATLDGQPVALRTPPLRIEYRRAGRSDVASWGAVRPGCTPAPLARPEPGEVAGSYMLALADSVDASAFARYLVGQRKLDVTVSAAHYLNLRGDDGDAAAAACLAGVQRIARDVEAKPQ
jgi:hypothetical protein